MGLLSRSTLPLTAIADSAPLLERAIASFCSCLIPGRPHAYWNTQPPGFNSCVIAVREPPQSNMPARSRFQAPLRVIVSDMNLARCRHDTTLNSPKTKFPKRLDPDTLRLLSIPGADSPPAVHG
jgi:hypothetical protein